MCFWTKVHYYQRVFLQSNSIPIGSPCEDLHPKNVNRTITAWWLSLQDIGAWDKFMMEIGKYTNENVKPSLWRCLNLKPCIYRMYRNYGRITDGIWAGEPMTIFKSRNSENNFFWTTWKRRSPTPRPTRAILCVAEFAMVIPSIEQSAAALISPVYHHNHRKSSSFIIFNVLFSQLAINYNCWVNQASPHFDPTWYQWGGKSSSLCR